MNQHPSDLSSRRQPPSGNSQNGLIKIGSACSESPPYLAVSTDDANLRVGRDLRARRVQGSGFCCALLFAFAFGCASPSRAALLAYEGFETGAGGYTADALLYGQTYQGFGEASGTWTVGTIGNTNSAVVSSTGLKHVVASSGGRVVFNAATGNGTVMSLDVSPTGPFATAGLVDNSLIGGPTVQGTVYISFLLRSWTLPSGWRWAGLQLYRDTTGLQSMGGCYSESGAQYYGIFGSGLSGNQYLRNNGGAGAPLVMNTSTRLFVAKVTFNAGGTDDFTVWMDPDPAKGDAQDATVYLYTKSAIGDLSFNQLNLRGGNSLSWDYDEIRVGTTWADVTPPTTETLVSDSFMTGSGGYTANAALPGQTALGDGLAGTAWVGDDANDSSVSADGLKHRKIFTDGGKAVHSGNGGKGTSTSFDTAWEGPMSLAGLLNSDGKIGGGNVSGPLYVSFLARFHTAVLEIPTQARFGGVATYLGANASSTQSMGGRRWSTGGRYSIFGASGDVDLLINGQAGTGVTVDTATHLFVAKMTFNPGTNDHLVVWLDPDPADGDNQASTVRFFAKDYVGDLTFDQFSLRGGNDSPLAGVDLDEIRFGRTWASVTPNPPLPTVICVR
ncbi:MAG: hypothetical protein PHW08_01065 [Kiritimatiellae bacterium]|nr:hypothetical protein [Kiritimatiellia bacterium]